MRGTLIALGLLVAGCTDLVGGGDAGVDGGVVDASSTRDAAFDGGPCANPDVDGDDHDAIACGGDDCDDEDGARYPGAVDVCDDIDQDCDLSTLADPSIADADNDGVVSIECCNPGDDGLMCGTDCDDTQIGIHPGAPESCNSADDDCDGEIDEGVLTTCWVDGDGDGFAAMGAATSTACACPEGTTAERPIAASVDCDDEDDRAFPGQTIYFAVARTSGGFDFDCDEEETPRWTERHDCNAGLLCEGCTLVGEGWLGASPSCGVAGMWPSACHCGGGLGGCVADPATADPRPQRCR